MGMIRAAERKKKPHRQGRCGRLFQDRNEFQPGAPSLRLCSCRKGGGEVTLPETQRPDAALAPPSVLIEITFTGPSSPDGSSGELAR